VSSITNVTALFDDIGKNMLKFFSGWDTHVPHQGEKGGVRERRVRDFLKSYLPRKYSVASGHIIDRQGNVSLQEDIVIFDGTNSPILRIDDYYQVFPCESVYATVEVKSTLNTTEIEKCIEHTNNLSTLDRGNLSPIESFVFAYDSYSSKDLQPPVWAAGNFKKASVLNGSDKAMPSVVLSLKQNFVLYFGLTRDKHIAQGVDHGVLLFFLNAMLNRLAAVEITPPSLFHDYGFKGNPLKHYGYSIKIDGEEI